MLYRFDGKQPVVGKTTYVSETATIIGDVRIGEHCYIGPGAILRGDHGTIEVGNETAVEEGVIVHTPPDQLCSIGNGVILGHSATIHCKAIYDSVVVGMGAVLSMQAEIGHGSVIAEGAIVKQGDKIPELIVVAGNPAKKVRDISDREIEWSNRARQGYVDLATKYCCLGMEEIDLRTAQEPRV